MKNRIHWPTYIEFARELRKRQTPEEQIIWNSLRNRRFWGHKFLRQHVISITQLSGSSHFYIAHFYCAEKMFVLEIDGPFHDTQTDYDNSRGIVMKELNLVVLRITNDDGTNRLEEVLHRIFTAVNTR